MLALLATRASLNLVWKGGGHRIICAAVHHSVARRALAVGVLVQAKSSVNVKARRVSRKTPVLLAAQQGHADVLQVLVQVKADVDEAPGDVHRNTPTITAAREDHATALQVLLLDEADVNRAGRWSYGTPVCVGAARGGIVQVKMLVQAKAHVHMRRRNACVRGCAGRPRQRVAGAGAEVDKAAHDGTTHHGCGRPRGAGVGSTSQCDRSGRLQVAQLKCCRCCWCRSGQTCTRQGTAIVPHASFRGRSERLRCCFALAGACQRLPRPYRGWLQARPLETAGSASSFGRWLAAGADWLCVQEGAPNESSTYLPGE